MVKIPSAYGDDWGHRLAGVGSQGNALGFVGPWEGSLYTFCSRIITHGLLQKLASPRLSSIIYDAAAAAAGAA